MSGFGFGQRGGKLSAAGQLASERREREDNAPRLIAQVPDLTGLKLSIRESSDDMAAASVPYIRRVVVAQASAVFWLPCGNPYCADGGHDVTHVIMDALRHHRAESSGEDRCHGTSGGQECGRIVKFELVAEYAKPV